MSGISVDEILLKNIERINKLKKKYFSILNINIDIIDVDVVIENGEVIRNPNQDLNEKQLEIFNNLSEKLKLEDKSIEIVLLKNLKYKDFYGRWTEERPVFYIKEKDNYFIIKNIL
ncbi:TPA: hypothetical protein I9080_002091 [Clostridium perfringens]|uniref:Uncharacterized protein n=2 Tax=Clostridium perfringens TaxID=1502 RepID=A0A8H9UX80_CLOPF|nr:hypothetical protein [Clostridium perfringens]EDT15893.1 hypothetical protein AC3_A0176 [Clostridium perfringens E str. JGS1987]MCX0407818.1 hypothetical protein [Clostridium perfringens]HAT4308281.1 hypothetical protein [Clostridium perfringens]